MSEQRYNPIAASTSYVVILGTWLVIATLAVLLGINWYVTHDTHVPGTMLLCGIAGVYVTIAYMLLRRYYYTITAYLLVIFYLVLTSSIVWSWGINAPIGPLGFGLVIVLAGILLSARHALFAGVASALTLLIIQTVAAIGWYQPDTSWTGNQSTFGDVLGYCTVFGMLALVSWLYNREMERALAHARRAETALRQQKATLRRQVKERTKDLRRVQLDEMRQMYHFAELGQAGVTLLHDLANHVTALTLEIEHIDKRHPEEMARAQTITRYLGDLINNTRQRLHGGTQKRTFDIVRKISETVDFLHYKAVERDVTIKWQPPIGSWKYAGDPDSFGQVIAILISNAIDAYNNIPHSDEHHVVLTLQPSNTHISIRVEDWGKGITRSRRKLLFKPHHSTKKSGLGLGLYIAKQIVEMQFLGTMALSPKTDHTEFVIRLPHNDK